MSIDLNTKISELEFTKEELEREFNQTGPDVLWSCDTPEGRFTVLSRETGYTYDGFRPMRDIETGFRDNSRNFSLRSGGFDVRRFPDLTLEQAIELIKNP